MKVKGMACLAVLAILCALVATAPAAEKGFLWDGTQWKDMTKELKVAYVKGIGNMADFETASGQGACLSRAFVDELKTKTVAQVITEVDKYYQENPGKQDMPVIAVILQRCTKLCAVPPAEKKK
jgi:hypothetical protein